MSVWMSRCGLGRLLKFRLVAAVSSVGLVFGMVGFAGRAHAVVNGVPDGNQHPYVGNIFAYGATGAFVAGCSGTLVNQTTVLTAAHCVNVPGAVTFEVSFDSSTGPSNYPAHYIAGTPDPNPAWMLTDAQPGTASFLANEANDLGLLHLAQPAGNGWPGIQPATIAAPNALAPYANGNGSHEQLFLQVGYGVERHAGSPPGQGSSYTYDGVRYQSQWPVTQLTDALFFGHSNPNNAIGYGGVCFGDSGSPLLLKNVVVGVMAFVANSACQNRAGGVRVDAGPGRDFLASEGLVP
jgi:hypothetical protein